MNTARISSIRWPIHVLGPGERVGVWFQGCTLACGGCLAKDTWSPAEGVEVDPEQIVDAIGDAQGAEGVTISGGEPLQQPDALRELLRLLRDRHPELNTLVYTGYDQDELLVESPWIFEDCDALIAGRFVSRLAADDHWRGSSNQELIVNSHSSHETFEVWTQQRATRSLQISTRNDQVEIVGIPQRGQLRSLGKALEQEGLTLHKTGWR